MDDNEKYLDKNKRINDGKRLILIGFSVPFILFFFASQYNHNLGLIENIMRMEFILQKGKGYYNEGKITLPYIYPFAAGLISIFVGIGKIILTTDK